MSFNFGRIPRLTAVELAALERLKNRCTYISLLALLCLHFYWFFFILAGTRTTIKARMSLNFNQIGLLTAKLTALERLEKFLWTYNGKNVVTTVVPLFLNVSSSFLQGKDNQKGLGVFEFLPDSTTDYRVAVFECIKKKSMSPLFLSCY